MRGKSVDDVMSLIISKELGSQLSWNGLRDGCYDLRRAFKITPLCYLASLALVSLWNGNLTAAEREQYQWLKRCRLEKSKQDSSQ